MKKMEKKLINNEFKLANDPETSQDILEKLSMHNDEHIRAAVALNINSSEHTLSRLAEDVSFYVRDSLIMNQKLHRSKFKINQDKFIEEKRGK